MVVAAAVATIEAMVATEEGEGAMVEAAMVAKVMNIIKVGSVTDFQCCGKNLSVCCCNILISPPPPQQFTVTENYITRPINYNECKTDL